MQPKASDAWDNNEFRWLDAQRHGWTLVTEESFSY